MSGKIIIFTGGTMVHVAPHFSLCAPAYGKVGREIQAALIAEGLSVELMATKMAGGDIIETNDDLARELNKVLIDPDVKGIVMAAAVCDFEPSAILGDMPTVMEFGKNTRRLSSKESLTLELEPSEKIIDCIKKQRPDICLVTFKTTSNDTLANLISKATDNAERSGADMCFGNDIGSKTNILLYHRRHGGGTWYSDRSGCIAALACKMKSVIVNG